MSDLLERLRKVESSKPVYEDSRYYQSTDTIKVTTTTTNWLRNPDGPEAADEIERLQQRNTELEKLVRPWIDASGVYHRHDGIDWPSAEHCAICKNERLRELLVEVRTDLTTVAAMTSHSNAMLCNDLVARIDKALEPPK